MAKNEISDYDETDAGNTDISGIGLSDATLIDALDNISRAQMGALKRWFKTSLFRLRDSTDQTKLLAFDLSGLSSGTRTITVPNGSGTLVYEGLAQTLTNKTLTQPIITQPTITLKQSAAPTPTAEGDLQWDSDDNRIVVGDGAGQAVFGQVTPWVAYTPTLTGFGTATGVSISSRRVGDTLEIMGRFTAGTTTATEARMTLGFNGVNGGITATLASLRMVGNAVQSVAEAASIVVLGEPVTAYITFGIQNATNTGFVKANGNLVLATGSTISIRASVPITGW